MSEPYDTKPDMHKVYLEQQQHMSMPHTYGDPQGPQSNGNPYHVEPHHQQQQHQQPQAQLQQSQEYGYPPQHPQHPHHMQHPQQMQQLQQQHPNAPPQNMQYGRPQPPPQALPAVDLTPVSKVQPPFNNHGPRRFTLEIAQQPDRARMCGFGDKDRRPITPPPCIRLVIIDENTGKELDYSMMECPNYILQVDLWNPDGSAAVNCVQHSNTSPSVSISMATTTSYPPQPEVSNFLVHQIPGQGPYMQPGQQYGQQYGQYQSQGYYPNGPGGAMMPTVSSGNYTRNLIGSCSVSAYSLLDENEKVGLWFVLQDLSVRTEGSFRLKFSFIDIGEFIPKITKQPKEGDTVPVLASAFSDIFTVWSAKKFPGVKESTSLSKCFAGQGVKIPIRKEGGGKGGKGGDDDDGAGDD